MRATALFICFILAASTVLTGCVVYGGGGGGRGRGHYKSHPGKHKGWYKH